MRFFSEGVAAAAAAGDGAAPAAELAVAAPAGALAIAPPAGTGLVGGLIGEPATTGLVVDSGTPETGPVELAVSSPPENSSMSWAKTRYWRDSHAWCSYSVSGAPMSRRNVEMCVSKCLGESVYWPSEKCSRQILNVR